MDTVDPEDLGAEELLVLVVSTYTDGQPPAQAKVGSSSSLDTLPVHSSARHSPMLTEGGCAAVLCVGCLRAVLLRLAV